MVDVLPLKPCLANNPRVSPKVDPGDNGRAVAAVVLRLEEGAGLDVEERFAACRVGETDGRRLVAGVVARQHFCAAGQGDVDGLDAGCVEEGLDCTWRSAGMNISFRPSE